MQVRCFLARQKLGQNVLPDFLFDLVHHPFCSFKVVLILRTQVRFRRATHPNFLAQAPGDVPLLMTWAKTSMSARMSRALVRPAQWQTVSGLVRFCGTGSRKPVHGPGR